MVYRLLLFELRQPSLLRHLMRTRHRNRCPENPPLPQVLLLAFIAGIVGMEFVALDLDLGHLHCREPGAVVGFWLGVSKDWEVVPLDHRVVVFEEDHALGPRLHAAHVDVLQMCNVEVVLGVIFQSNHVLLRM